MAVDYRRSFFKFIFQVPDCDETNDAAEHGTFRNDAIAVDKWWTV